MFKNHVDLIGFIGSDPETRQLENGATMTSFPVATKSSWKNDSGSYDSRTEWHRIVVWGKLAQFAATLRRGAHIEVEGQLRRRTHRQEIPTIHNKNVAVDMTITEIHASVIRKLDRNTSPTDSGDDDLSDEAPE